MHRVFLNVFNLNQSNNQILRYAGRCCEDEKLGKQSTDIFLKSETSWINVFFKNNHNVNM